MPPVASASLLIAMWYFASCEDSAGRAKLNILLCRGRGALSEESCEVHERERPNGWKKIGRVALYTVKGRGRKSQVRTAAEADALAVNAKLKALEGQKAALEDKLVATPDAEPLLHPALATIYRGTVERLEVSLRQPDTGIGGGLQPPRIDFAAHNDLIIIDPIASWICALFARLSCRIWAGARCPLAVAFNAPSAQLLRHIRLSLPPDGEANAPTSTGLTEECSVMPRR